VVVNDTSVTTPVIVTEFPMFRLFPLESLQCKVPIAVVEGLTQVVEQVLLTGWLVPLAFWATAETAHTASAPGVQETGNAVSASAKPPAGTLLMKWLRPLSVITIVATPSPQFLA